MNRQVSTLGVVIVIGLVMTGVYFIAKASIITWDPIQGERRNVEVIRRISLDSIDKVSIYQGGVFLEINPKDDGHDVKLLLDSLKRISIENRERRSKYCDRIAICRKSGSVFVIGGCFDPDCAPVISKAMRSDDLGEIVYDIFKRRGIQPRKK